MGSVGFLFRQETEVNYPQTFLHLGQSLAPALRESSFEARVCLFSVHEANASATIEMWMCLQKEAVRGV